LLSECDSESVNVLMNAGQPISHFWCDQSKRLLVDRLLAVKATKLDFFTDEKIFLQDPAGANQNDVRGCIPLPIDVLG